MNGSKRRRRSTCYARIQSHDSARELNAVEWIGKEWEDKPVSLIGYGWRSGASQAHATAREALAVNLKANVLDTQANLFFMKDFSPTGRHCRSR